MGKLETAFTLPDSFAWKSSAEEAEEKESEFADPES
jgi:hypothetical protein